MNKIVIVSGPVGAGKTTVSKELAAISEGPLVLIDGDKFWDFGVRGKGIGREAFFRATMTAIITAALAYALYDMEAIVDFSIPPWFLSNIRKIAAKRNLPVHYILLMPAQQTCAARAGEREKGRVDDYEALAEFYDSFAAGKKYALENDFLEPTEAAKMIRDIIDHGTHCISDETTS